MLGQPRRDRAGGEDSEASEQTNWASGVPVWTPENLPWTPATIPHIIAQVPGTALRIHPRDMNAPSELLHTHYCSTFLFLLMTADFADKASLGAFDLWLRTSPTTQPWAHWLSTPSSARPRASEASRFALGSFGSCLRHPNPGSQLRSTPSTA